MRNLISSLIISALPLTAMASVMDGNYESSCRVKEVGGHAFSKKIELSIESGVIQKSYQFFKGGDCLETLSKDEASEVLEVVSEQLDEGNLTDEVREKLESLHVYYSFLVSKLLDFETVSTYVIGDTLSDNGLEVDITNEYGYTEYTTIRVTDKYLEEALGGRGLYGESSDTRKVYFPEDESRKSVYYRTYGY